MSGDHEPKSNHRNAVWPVAFVMLPVMYVLSIGPVAGVCCQLGHDVDFSVGLLGTVYWPLDWLADEVPWIAACLNAYVFWFSY